MALSDLFEPRSFWIYTDGSGTDLGFKTGAYSATIMLPNNTFHTVAGTCFPTTNNRMELSAINASLFFVRELLNDVVHNVSLNIVSDSEITVNIIKGTNRAHKNTDLWAQFRQLQNGFESISASHIPRNSEQAQSQADAICHVLRVHFEEVVERVMSSEDFKTMSFSKTSIRCPNEDRRPGESGETNDTVPACAGQR